MSYKKRVAYLVRGQVRSWPMCAIHLLLPVALAAIWYGAGREIGRADLLVLLISSSLAIWAARVAYVASLPWDVEEECEF